MLEEESVQLVGPRCPRTPVTAVMPVGPERAMVTYDPGVRARAADVAALAPRAVITGLSQLDVVPAGAQRLRQRRRRRRARVRRPPPGAASRVTGLFIEQREALVLTGAGTAAGGRRDDRRPRADRRRLARRGWRRGVHRGPRRQGRGLRRRPLRSTPPARATCSWPPGRGARRSAWTSTTRSSGPRSTPRCPCACRQARAARPASGSSWRRARAAALPAPPPRVV